MRTAYFSVSSSEAQLNVGLGGKLIVVLDTAKDGQSDKLASSG
jgi:hypothetical protein